MDECDVCGKKYVGSEVRTVPDSHFSYVHYKPCPVCKYTGELKDKIEKILEEKTSVKFVPGQEMVMNTDELTNLIVKAVIKNWPNPKKK
ncbi:MAG: hypothetical protein V1839_02825 [archaeon]